VALRPARADRYDSLESPRLLLRSMRWGDVAALLQTFGDARVMAAFGVPPFDRSDMERWVRRNLDHQDKHGYGLFTVVERTNGEVIGDCGLEWTRVRGVPVAELGYDLRHDMWGRGLATEAAACVRDFALGALGLPRVVSLIREGNVASRRVAEKVGMRHVGDLGGDHPYWVLEVATHDLATDDRRPPASPARAGPHRAGT